MSKVDQAVNFVAMAPTMTKDTAAATAATNTAPALIDNQQQVKMLSGDEQAWSKLWSSSSTPPASVVQEQQQHGSLPSPAALYHCHICSFTGQTEGEFKQHMLSHYNHACPQCDYASRTEGRLRRHIREFHTPLTSKRGSGQPKLFRCRQCQFVASDKVVFWEHSASHIKAGRMQRCPHCPFVTEYKHHLEYHLRNHAGSKPFQCTKCNYSCVNKSMLNSHMKSHTNVYQYRCADCTFATKYCHSLRLHLDKTTHRAAAVLNPDGSLPAADVKDTFNDVIKRGDRSGTRSSKTRRQRCLTPDRSRSPKSETSAQQSFNVSSISPFMSQNASSRTASCSFPEAPVALLPPLLPMANLFLPHPHPQSILSPYPDPRPPAGLCKNEVPDDVTPHSPKIDSGDGRGAWSEYVKSMVRSFQASVGSSVYGSELSLYHQGHHMSLSPHLSPYYGVQRVQQQVSLASSSSSANNTANWLLDSKVNVSELEDSLFKPSFTAAGAEANAVASAVADEETDTVQNTDEAAAEVPLDLSIQSRCNPSSPQGHSKNDSEVTSPHPPSSEASLFNSNLNSIVSDIVCKSEVAVDNISMDVAILPRKNRRKGTARKVDVTVVNGDQVYTEPGGSCWLGDSAVNGQHSNINTDLDPTTEPTKRSGLTNDLENISPVSEGNSNTCRQFGSAKSQDGGWLYECQHCLLSFRDYVMYILHKGYHGYTDPFRCNLCGQTSANRVDFFVHIAQVAHE